MSWQIGLCEREIAGLLEGEVLLQHDKSFNKEKVDHRKAFDVRL